MICKHCGKMISNESLSFCVMCGYPLKSDKGFFAKSPDTGTSRAEDYAAQEPAPAPPPQMGAMPGVMPQQPQMAAMPGVMPQQPQMGAMPGVMPQQPQMTAMPGVMPQQPQMGAMPGVMPQQPQMGAMPGVMPQQPQMGAMPGVMPQPQMGMMMPNGYVQPQMGMMMPNGYVQPQMGAQEMPDAPAGYAMPQMPYGMPQFAGYDPNGNPLYVQMVPQLMGYDPYGNPLYSMAAVPYVMPQPVMPVPQPPVQSVQPVMPQPAAPLPMMSEPEPVTDVQQYVEVTSAEDLPVSAEALMEEEAPAEPPPVQEMPDEVPDEEELLDRIFGDAPKTYTMSTGTKPSGQVFSINVGSDEIISVADEEAPPPPARSRSKAADTEKQAAKPKKQDPPKEEKKPAETKKKAAPKKSPAKLVSPDAFFDDAPKAQQDTVTTGELDRLSDEQLVEKLATMQSVTRRKSTRSMKAAPEEGSMAALSVEDQTMR